MSWTGFNWILIEIFVNKDRRIQWTSDLVKSSPSSTVIVQRPLGEVSILTANPANVQHILKSRFDIYQKGDEFWRTFSDLLGNEIFSADGQVEHLGLISASPLIASIRCSRRIQAEQSTFKSYGVADNLFIQATLPKDVEIKKARAEKDLDDLNASLPDMQEKLEMEVGLHCT
ncbi:hypothetical protein LguiA_000130 [Lonicera macranthoides]